MLFKVGHVETEGDKMIMQLLACSADASDKRSSSWEIHLFLKEFWNFTSSI